MEYIQMTLDDWVQMKQKLRQELIGVKQSFVRIGYALRQIDDQRLYENDGYKSIAEFAKAEYGLEASTTSRFMSINREYSIDGYSEHLRPEYTDLGRSQLEEMLKLPDSDRQMIQPEASREDIRELKRFNKTEPAAGVADDTSQLIEKFFEDNKDILNEVYSNEFDEESMNRFAEIVNPAGNRSFKKGLYFMMMYENRVTIKKFGDTPKNMSWWEFYKLMCSIFDEDAAGARTWQNHFGGEDEVQENEPTGEHITAETPESEDDDAAVGEAGTDEVEETESGSVADNEPAPGAGEEQKDDSTDGDTDCREDNREPADRAEEQTGEKSLAEQIAPAQKSPQILEKSEPESIEKEENEAQSIEENEPEIENEKPGDILYVRETFAWCPCWDCGMDTEQGACTDHIYHSEKKEYGCYMYRASCEDNEYPSADTWHPSIHMPKEAARIWLKVTDVRVERLQEIDEDGAWNEGFRFTIPCLTRISADGHTCDLDGPCTSPIKYCDMTMGELFGRELWNSTIKKSDLDRYGWNANPWVWVIEFELCEKPKGEN